MNKAGEWKRSILLGKNIVCDAHNLIFLLAQTSLIPNSCRLGIQPDRQRGLSQLSQKDLLSGLTLTLYGTSVHLDLQQCLVYHLRRRCRNAE